MKKNRGKALIFLGLLLIAAALFLTGYNLYDEARAQRTATQAAARLEELLPNKAPAEQPAQPEREPKPSPEAVIPDYILNPDMEMPTQSIDGLDYIGVLRIPALGLELPVISRWSDSNLKTAPCRYSGSAYQDDLVIAAHNYSSHFGHLKNLREGDAVTFTDMDGNEFTYEMVERETIQPTDLEGMASGAWDLTLFTCTLGGSSRITLRFARTLGSPSGGAVTAGD